MIYNRTQDDINEAIRIRREKVQAFQELTDDEKLILEKGTLTINTLNRIESKQKELQDALNELIYFVQDLSNKEWSYTDFFKQEDFDRICKNNELLKKAFMVYADTPKSQDKNFLKYQSINTIERVLHDIDAMIEDIKANYKICGNTVCGE